MDRAIQIDLAKRLLAHAEAGTTDMAPAQTQVPVSSYLDVDVWREEIDQFYMRLPIVACLSSELPEPGSYLAFSIMDVPLLLTRDAQGGVNAFLNVCRHRGSRVALPAECGAKAKRFSCVYHGWTYDNQGKLIGVANSETFGSVDRSTLGLRRIQADERAGMVFVILTPGVSVDIDDYLAGVDRHIGNQADSFRFVGASQARGSNWKIVVEGHLEAYHFSTLHRNTIGPVMINNCATIDRFGPHILITYCSKDILSLRNKPEAEWEPLKDDLINPQYILFPSTSVALFGDAMLAQIIRPESTLDKTISRLAYAQSPDGDFVQGEAKLQAVADLVETEDYWAGRDIYDGMKSGAQSSIMFGRNEPGLTYFHEALQSQKDRSAALA